MQPILLFLPFDQIEEVASSVHGATRESHIVIPPIDTSNLAIMALDLHILCHFSSVEVVYIDKVALAKRGSKQMSSIAELDLSALLHTDARVLLDTV